MKVKPRDGLGFFKGRISFGLTRYWKLVSNRGMVSRASSAAFSIFFKLLFFDRLTVPVAAVICLTLLTTVIVAKFVGCTLPVLAKKIGFDPTVMASPFITTIVDALSLLVYFGAATALLHL